MNIITNAVAPMDEITLDGVNGLTVASRPDGEARSGIPAHSFDTEAMAAAIDRLASEEELRTKLADGAAKLRDGERAWEHTIRGFDSLLEMAAP